MNSNAARPEIFWRIFFIIFDRKMGLILLLQHAAFENGHTYESNSINVSNCISLDKRKIVLSDGIHYISSNLVKFLRF